MKARTKEEIIKDMTEVMPFRLSESIKPYVFEAMEIYAEQQVKSVDSDGGGGGNEVSVCDVEKGTRCKDSFASYQDGKCYRCGGQAN